MVALTPAAGSSALFTAPATAELARIAGDTANAGAIFASDEIAYAASAGLMAPIAGTLLGAVGASDGWRVVCGLIVALWAVALVLWLVVMRPNVGAKESPEEESLL